MTNPFLTSLETQRKEPSEHYSEIHFTANSCQVSIKNTPVQRLTLKTTCHRLQMFAFDSACRHTAFIFRDSGHVCTSTAGLSKNYRDVSLHSDLQQLAASAFHTESPTR